MFKENTLKLLVVDDSSTMRRIIKNTLQRLGYDDILEAENGVWTLNEDDNFQMQVFFRVTSEDNIFILGVCEF